MKFKSLIIILLSGLSLQMYSINEPIESGKPHNVSGSSSHESPAHEVPESKKSESVQDSATPPKSSLKKSDAPATAKPEKVVSFGDNTVTEFKSPEPIKLKVDEGADDYAAIDPHEGLSVDQIPSDFGKDNEDIIAHNTFMNKLIVKATPIEKATLEQERQAEKDASIKLAKDLEGKARAAKTDADIKNIVMEDIDPTGKLTPEIIDDAIQASKIWRDPFDGTMCQRWVEVLSRITSYVKTGKPVPDEFVAELKKLVSENKGKIENQQDAQAAQAKIEAAKQAKIKNIDAKIAKNDQLIQAKINDSSELVSQIQSKESDIGLHYALNDPLNTRYVFGDSGEVTAIKKEISQLEAQVEQSQKDISAIAQDSNDLQAQKSLFNEGGDVDSLGKAESAQVEKSSPTTQPKEHLCDSIEECIKKMNDPADQASLSSLFKEMNRLSKDPDFKTKYNEQQQEAIKYFVDNGENIIGSVSFAVWNARTIRSQAVNLPKEPGVADLSESNLITKAQANPARVQAEQQAALQSKSTASTSTDLFTSTSMVDATPMTLFDGVSSVATAIIGS